MVQIERALQMNLPAHQSALIFLSHSSKDRDFVEQKLIPFLRNRGFDTWDSAVDIPTADDWERTILKGLRSCDYFLVVLSVHSIQSEWVRAEVHWAMENRQGRVVPILLTACNPLDLHLKLALVQHVDLREDSRAAWDKLAAVWRTDSTHSSSLIGEQSYQEAIEVLKNAVATTYDLDLDKNPGPERIEELREMLADIVSKIAHACQVVGSSGRIEGVELLKKLRSFTASRSTNVDAAGSILTDHIAIEEGAPVRDAAARALEHLGVAQNQPVSRAESDRYRDLGRAKVQLWGERLNREGRWEWDLLGHAIDHYVDAIRRDSENQHPWTNLAYVLYLVGEKEKAYQCLERSLSLAEPGPNHPGNNYKQVKHAIDNGAYLSGGKVERPAVPHWFWKKHGRLPP